MTARRIVWVYGILLAVWLVIAGWQVVEHTRVREATRSQVVYRARDITSTLALVLRSQRRFGVISRERLESALTELIRPGAVNAIALLSAEGEVIASAGDEFDISAGDAARAGVHWAGDVATVVNVVDLGTNVTQESESPPPTLVIPREQLTNFPPPPPRGPPPTGEPRPEGSLVGEPLFPPPTAELDRTNYAAGTNPPSRFGSGWRGPRGTNSPGSTNRASFSRPFWMNEADYRVALKKQGVHRCAIVMSSATMRASIGDDLWLRTLVCLLAAAAAGISAVAWRNLTKSADLQLRLVRASEMNAHLKEMNLAAAGLAHETRNPLNIIRGLAQMISRTEPAPAEVREKSRSILEETDRVTAQLNEFINYSRPREVRRSPVSLARVAGEVARALAFDAEEKHATLKVPEDAVVIEADEQLFRQTLFNLLLNAIQAVDEGGMVEVAIVRGHGAGAALEIRDNGPGVAPEHRGEIFKPYFTTHQRGTGLGLAVVQQIVSAHGWEIECIPNQPRGAIFRINRLKLVEKS